MFYHRVVRRTRGPLLARGHSTRSDAQSIAATSHVAHDRHSLLQYFSTVYWEPMAQRRRDASQQAWELLQKYDQATIDLKSSAVKRPRPSRDEKNDASSDVSSDGISDNEALVCVNGLW
jgi:hypothetical protein